MARTDTPSPVLAASGLASPRVESLVLLAVWLFFLILALRTLGPDSLYTNFTADCAIPILMANDERPITVFDTYYFAADRYGAWPFLIGKWLHQHTGIHWTDQSIHYAKTIWLFLGLLMLAALNARAAPAVLVSGLIALCLEPTSVRLMFDVGQVYAWQLPALMLAWFCMRHLLAPQIRVHFWSVSFYLSAFFAIWLSVGSAPLLSVLLTVEALRSHFLFPKRISKPRIGLALLLLLAATASELLLKKNYHRYSLKHFGNEFKTALALDFGYLHENLLVNWHNLIQFKMSFLIIVAVSFVAGIVGLLLYARIIDRRLLKRVRSLFEDETVTMIVALTAMAATSFLLTISVNHVRFNDYNVRFHALTYLFAATAGLLTIYLAIRLSTNRFGAKRPVLAVVVVCAFIWLGVEFPRRSVSEAYKLNRQTALALSQKGPGSILMGGYWETYLLAALQPTNTMTPLPMEGVLNRMPWTPAMLHDSRQVVIEYRVSGVAQNDSLPPNELRQYGNLLRLQEARFYENGPYAFALYVNEGSKP